MKTNSLTFRTTLYSTLDALLWVQAAFFTQAFHKEGAWWLLKGGNVLFQFRDPALGIPGLDPRRD